eukprot:214670-Rhodomonas_salina.1
MEINRMLCMAGFTAVEICELFLSQLRDHMIPVLDMTWTDTTMLRDNSGRMMLAASPVDLWHEERCSYFQLILQDQTRLDKVIRTISESNPFKVKFRFGQVELYAHYFLVPCRKATNTSQNPNRTRIVQKINTRLYPVVLGVEGTTRTRECEAFDRDTRDSFLRALGLKPQALLLNIKQRILGILEETNKGTSQKVVNIEMGRTMDQGWNGSIIKINFTDPEVAKETCRRANQVYLVTVPAGIDSDVDNTIMRTDT